MATRSVIKILKLRPTQLTVGMASVKHKRLGLRALEKRPSELVEFILKHPIRVVLGPKEKAYVIDHHHLALALLKENFETAPMDVEADFSNLSVTAFWKKMEAKHFVHAFDANGVKRPLSHIPVSLELLKDDPFRSLSGFVREAGGFDKVQTPFAEFAWADFFRVLIKRKFVKNHMDKAIKEALLLSQTKAAKDLPGYLKPSSAKAK